ncbi:Metallo-dependent phosphatase, partial [Tothia fuscella]
ISLVCISDTHNKKCLILDGDILLHAGDLTQYGFYDEIQVQLLDEDFVNRHPDRELDKIGKSRSDIDWGDIIYLENTSVEVKCHCCVLKIYGSPMTPKCGSFAFQYSGSEDFWENGIPKDTNIILTHGPPALHLDEGKGCPDLLNEIWRTKPDLVVFGHIHNGRGQQLLQYDDVQAYYENIQLGRQPWTSLFKLFLTVIWQKLRGNLLSVSGATGTHLVNAAIVAGRVNEEVREAMMIKM